MRALSPLVELGEERFDDRGVELGAGVPAQLFVIESQQESVIHGAVAGR